MLVEILTELLRECRYILAGAAGFQLSLDAADAFVQGDHGHQFDRRGTDELPDQFIIAAVHTVRGQTENPLLFRRGCRQAVRAFADFDVDLLSPPVLVFQPGDGLQI